MLIEKTQQEQTEVQARIESTRKQLSDEVKIAYDAQQWKEAISQYADIQELDAATLNLLVKSVAVHEKIDDDGERHITIPQEYWRYFKEMQRSMTENQPEFNL